MGKQKMRLAETFCQDPSQVQGLEKRTLYAKNKQKSSSVTIKDLYSEALFEK